MKCGEAFTFPYALFSSDEDCQRTGDEKGTPSRSMVIVRVVSCPGIRRQMFDRTSLFLGYMAHLGESHIGS